MSHAPSSKDFCLYEYVQCSRVNDIFGRRWTLRIVTVIYIAGVLGQGLCDSSLSGLYASRFISGLGIGPLSIVPPVYITEVLYPSTEILSRGLTIFQDFTKRDSRPSYNFVCILPAIGRGTRFLYQLWDHQALSRHRQAMDDTNSSSTCSCYFMDMRELFLPRVSSMARIPQQTRRGNCRFVETSTFTS